jgi:hypothetical protein
VLSTVAALGTRFSVAKSAKSQLEKLCSKYMLVMAEADDICKKELERAEARAKKELVAAKKKHIDKMQQAKEKAQADWKALLERRDAAMAPVDKRYQQKSLEADKRRVADTKAAEQRYAKRLAEIKQRYASDTADATRRREQRLAEIESQTAGGWQSLANTWKQGLDAVVRGATEVRDATNRLFPPWNDPSWTDYKPTTEIPDVLRFGTFHVREEDVPGATPPSDTSLGVLPRAEFDLPALQAFPEQCSLLFKAELEGRDRAVEAIQAVMFRLLTGVAPGKVRFTILDPAGLGHNFAAFMNLVDHDAKLVTDRIWTEAAHIDQRLSDLTAHIENVVQAFLRNRFESIMEYNAQAGEVAEPFRVVVAANFPVNFNDEAARRLVSISRNGPRCGVFTLISVDTRQPMPPGFDIADLESSAIVLEWRDGRYLWRNPDFGRYPLVLETSPPEHMSNRLLEKVGQAAAAAGRVEVPFEFVAPQPEDWWKSSSRSGLQVPIGRAGAMKRQSLELGRGTSQHVLIAGKTGSGKSTLLHGLITNAVLCFSPEELELYLIDFKKGVEFKHYAEHLLPHAKVVAIESEREFGLSVLQRLDAELTRRGELFRAVGAQDLGSYRATGNKLPRILMIVDEFQEFFIEDDRLARDAAQLFDRLVRQGRAFGLHLILGSQSIGGAYSLARSTIDQMAVRIALQCSEADANLILSQDNSAARLLSRPGEAIYNDANGLVEGNNPFQVVWLPEEKREKYLVELRRRAADLPGPVVFEGNAPADISRNVELSQWLSGAAEPELPRGGVRAWVGEATALTGHTEFQLRRLNGNNVVTLGQDDQSALGMMSTVMATIALQLPPNAPRPSLHLLDATQSDAQNGVLGGLAQALGPIAKLGGVRQIPTVLGELHAEMQRRQQNTEEEGPPIFVLLWGIQRCRDLRRADDDYGFSMPSDGPPAPPQMLTELLRDGSTLGIHLLIWCDTLTNLKRSVDRNSMRELALRIAMQMNLTDSTDLIDSPQAGKLGSHRALFFNEEEGRLEKFRPYAPPSPEWLAQLQKRLAALAERQPQSV